MSGDGMDYESEQLHAALARATEGISGIRVDPQRMLRARRRRRWQEAGAVVGVLSVVLAVGGFTLRQGGSDGGSGPIEPGSVNTPTAAHAPTPAHTVPSTPFSSPSVADPVAVEAYDADDGTEGKDTLNAFMTGKGPWRTDVYCQSHPTLEGRVKPGTGLVLDLGKPKPLTGIGFDGTRGTVEVWAADASVTAMPSVVRFAPPNGFHKVATITQADGKYPQFSATTRFLLVWYTELPPAVPQTSKITCSHGATAGYRGDVYRIVVFRRS